MTRYTAALDKSLDSRGQLQRELTAVPSPTSDAAICCNPLIARLFGGAEPMRKLAFTSFRSREGVSRTVGRVADEVRRTAGLRCTVVKSIDSTVDAAERPLQILGMPFLALETDRPPRVDPVRECDLILVDAGAMQANGAILSMARHVDGIVVVVEAGHTTESEVRQTVETIAAAGGRVIGLILNKQRNWIPTWLERLLRS